ncbi:hypothetical protein Emag_003347 [Eimeria magna]
MTAAVDETEPPAAADAAAAKNTAAAAAAAGDPFTAEDAALFLERAEDIAERVTCCGCRFVTLAAIAAAAATVAATGKRKTNFSRSEAARRCNPQLSASDLLLLLLLICLPYSALCSTCLGSGEALLMAVKSVLIFQQVLVSLLALLLQERLQQLEEERRRGREGLGLPSSDFDWYCVSCKVEYKNEQLQKQQQQLEDAHEEQQQRRCYRCGGSLTDRDSRLTWLQEQLAAAKQEKQLVLLRRQKQQQLLRTKAIVTKGPAAATAVGASTGPTDYEKWRFYEPESDEEEKQQQKQQMLEQTAPKETPELRQLEADMRKRQKHRGSQRHRAAALIGEGRAHAAAGSWLLAEEAFAAAVEAKPDSLVALSNLSLAQLKREGWRQAEETASKLLNICEVFENGYTRSRDLCYKALLRRAFARRQLLLLEQAAEDAAAAQQLLPNPVEAKALAAEIETLLKTISQQQEQQQQQRQQLADEAKGAQQPCTASPPAAPAAAETAAATTAAAATAADAMATAAAADHAAAEKRSTTAAGGSSHATEQAEKTGSPTLTSVGAAEDETLDLVFKELQRCGCLLHRLPLPTINSLLQHLKASEDARARLCTLQPLAPSPVGAAEASSREEADAAGVPLQLQMPRGPARCLLDFALQDIRLSAMNFKRRQQQQQHQQQHEQQQEQQQQTKKELCSESREHEEKPTSADAADAAGQPLLSSNVNNVDSSKADTDSSSSGDTAGRSSGGDSSSVDCSEALKLVLLVCSSSTPAALYESLLLPVLQNLLLLLQESRYTVAAAAVLAELSVHAKARKEMSRVAAADDKTAGLLLHWGSSAAEPTAAAAAGAAASCGEQGCALALQRTTCFAAAELLQQQTPQQQLLLLEAARRCLCNFSLEAPMRGVLQHQLLQQQQEGRSALLQALLPTMEEIEGVTEATAAEAEAISSKLDVLVNITKATKIRQQIWGSENARRRLAELLHKLTGSSSSTSKSKSSDRSSHKNNKSSEAQSYGSQQAKTAAAAGKLLLQQLTPEGQQRLLLLNLLLGLLLNLTTDAAAAGGHASAEANGAAAATILIRCLRLSDIAAVSAAGVAGAVAAAAKAKVEPDLNHLNTTGQLLSRCLSLAARILQQQPQQEEEQQGAAAEFAAAVVEVEAAAAVVLRCAVEKSTWSAAAAAAVRVLSVSAQQQRLLERAAATATTTAVAATSRGPTTMRQLNTKDLLQLLQPLMRLLIQEGRQRNRAAKAAPTADLAEAETAATEVFTALGNSLVLLTSLVRMQLSEKPKKQQQQEEDMLLPLLKAAAETLEFEHQPHVQRNAAICIAAAVQGSVVYKQQLWQQPLISKVLDAAKANKISSRR